MSPQGKHVATLSITGGGEMLKIRNLTNLTQRLANYTIPPNGMRLIPDKDLSNTRVDPHIFEILRPGEAPAAVIDAKPIPIRPVATDAWKNYPGPAFPPTNSNPTMRIQVT